MTSIVDSLMNVFSAINFDQNLLLVLAIVIHGVVIFLESLFLSQTHYLKLFRQSYEPREDLLDRM